MCCSTTWPINAKHKPLGIDALHPIHAGLNAEAHNHREAPSFTKVSGFAGAVAAMPSADEVVLQIRLRCHNLPPQQRTCGLAVHQVAADEFESDSLGGAGEEGLRPGTGRAQWPRAWPQNP